MQLPNQWTLQPAGKQIQLGDFPVNIAVHPSAKWAAVLHCGYGEHEVVVVDLASGEVTARFKLAQAFYGLTFDPAGKQLFASGAEFEVVHQFAFADGKLNDHKEIRIAELKAHEIPTGVACSPDGKTLYVANGWGSRLSIVPLDNPEKPEQLSLEKNSFPYAVLATRDGRRVYVSLWGHGGVAVIDGGKPAAIWLVGEPGVGNASSHPTEMVLSPDEKLLYVACSNSNSVVVLDTADGRPLEQIASALYPQAPPGSTPNSIALSSDGKVLLVANADNNNVAVIDVSQRGKSRSLGFIPVGWYPTSVRFTPGNKQILVANGKGIEPRANPDGPNPVIPKKKTKQYIGALLNGTLSVINSPSPGDMATFSQQARAASPLRADLSSVSQPRETNNPVPAKVGDKSPIKHCLYIIKENRTYDQVLGDIKEGNGDPKLAVFGEKVTPNIHALVRDFVLLDNLYCEAEVSADGHEWSTAAYATDFVEKTWPLNYRGHALGKLDYPSEGNFRIASPGGGYIWDRCKESGVSYRSYGEFIENGAKPGDPSHTSMKNLQGHFDPFFRGWDLDYPDAKRTDRFLEELRGYEKSGDLPQMIILRLPNDHTHGTTIGKPTPVAMVAENDLALGRLIEGISHSKYWPEMAVFIIEDDAQNGSDHVDAHRTEALVISPYTKRHAVDSTLYSTTSMLRTMELILGMKPMSQFDAAATPMFNSFQSKLDTTPYQHVANTVDIAATNPRSAWGAAESAKMDFSREDAADDLRLNEIVWHSIRGPESRMPPPVHAAFVRTRAKSASRPDDDD